MMVNIMPESDKKMQKLEAKLAKLAGIAGSGCVWKVSRYLLPEADLSPAHSRHICEFCEAVKAVTDSEPCVENDTQLLVARLKRNPAPQLSICHAGVAELVVPIPAAAGFAGVVMLGPFRFEANECRYPEAEDAFRRLPFLSAEAIEGYCEFIPALFQEVVQNAYADAAGLLLRRPRDERVLSVLEFLRRHASETPSAARVADTVFMSPSRLQHLFQHECGIGMGEFLLKLRLLRARRFLLGANWPIGRVAEMSGFPSQSYFTAMFRREFGMPPLQYRRKYGHASDLV